ncbi:exodeoxyribonuclease V subunit alpha [Spirabiliibacterium falconis]|uniref:exodeoxyribonuclease V subunit alpha n=1 Tax=Spirabiliibacterium falconis TaxID=572023 RepID=UPI001AACC65E|nr:exodeoxyribonuclease V subunit alpha [Spirabiliibacterium falconis]MBE2895161.1 exodeoxyribonuclease V subunit alpha [Spirabiliibacterium falconis]
MLAILQQLKHAELILPIDYQLAKMIASAPTSHSQYADNLAILLTAQLSYDLRMGSVCLDPHEFEQRAFFDINDPNYLPLLADIASAIGHIPPAEWEHTLALHSALTHTTPAPLVFSQGLLYFYRTFDDEQQIARHILQRIRQPLPPGDLVGIKKLLDQLFNPCDGIDWQKIAVAMALRSAFCVIAGGPGTGKTTTVCKLLLALQYQQRAQGLTALKVAMAAPTGKAAARLTESIRHNLTKAAQASNEAQLADQIECQAQTLHRMLGINMQTDKVRFNHANPLLADVVIVDEVSMVDLNWFARLLNAVRADARIILLGDEHQLASVESGAVLAQLCQGQDRFSPECVAYLSATTGQSVQSAVIGRVLRDVVCHLQQSHRFGEDSGIKALADAVNRGEKASWSVMARKPDLHCYDYGKRHASSALHWLISHASVDYANYLHAIHQNTKVRLEDVDAIFRAFLQVRYCCALRSGEFGVTYLNQAISEHLKREGALHFTHRDEWYHGKPIMITQNDSVIGLYNGDVGLCLRDEHGKLKVWFEQGQQQYIAFSPSRIPAFEPTFMMTVHKSQGSEFDKTVLVLPPTHTPLITRELLYTAITRAKREFAVFGNKAVWESGVQSPVQRRSGLYRTLTAL